MTDDQKTSPDIVYGDLGGALVLVPRDRAEELASVRAAVQGATTWGELRSRVSAERRAQIAEGYGDDEQPDDDTTLADEPVPGWDDGDWPEAPVQAMLDWVPAEVRALGEEVSTRLSGEHLLLEPARTDEVVAAMEAAGYSIQRNDALVERAAWS
jgi:hypothetical protein